MWHGHSHWLEVRGVVLEESVSAWVFRGFGMEREVWIGAIWFAMRGP